MTDGTSKSGVSWLDRPVLAGAKVRWWAVLYGVIVCFIVFTRLWGLSSRGFSHDESIHAWEAWKLVTGQGYSHSPVYHGPFLYHFTAMLFALFGHNDLTARLGAAIFGIALTIMPLFLKKWLGVKGALFTVLLMAVSPVMMARSRFLRHDVFVVFFNLLLLVAVLRYLDERKPKYLYLFAAALALGFTAKETTFITYFIFGTFLFGYLVIQWLRDRSQSLRDMPALDLVVVMGTLILPTATPFPVKLLGGDPVDYSQSGIIFSGSAFLVLLAVSIAIGALWGWRRWFICAGIYYAIFIPLFTTMFTNGQGFATGMVGQLGYWLSQQEVKRGGQPWYYYFVLMPMYEFLPLLLGLGGSIYFLFHSGTWRGAEDPEATDEDAGSRRGTLFFVALLIYWVLVAFLLYTWAGEKMPWLTMHLTLPLQLLAGWTGGRLLEADWRQIKRKGGLWLLALVPLFVFSLARLVVNRPSTGTSTDELSQTMGWLATLIIAIIVAVPISRIAGRLARKDVWRMVTLSVLVILIAFTLRFAWMVTFTNAALATEFLVYAQGTPDVALVADELERMSETLTGGLHMKVAYDDDSSWPFVWYLRDYDNAQFYGKKPAAPFDAEVVIVGSANEAAVKPLLGNKYYRRDYRLIWWPNQDWYMGFSPKKLWADVRDPEAREKLLDVILYREHEASLTSWPFVHNFSVHVRRDIAQQLWDYDPEAILTADTALPGDEYIEVWRQVPANAVWGSQGGGPGQFHAPKGIDVGPDGNVYIADSQNHRIQVLDQSGQPVREWGSQGNAPGQLNEPWAVGVAANGDVYVADTWNHRIQVFDDQGKFKTMWGTFSEVQDAQGPGNMLYGPRDIAFDNEGYLYVTDTGNKRVIKYDSTGRMVGAVGGTGEEEGQFQEPVGVAVGPDGKVYVADTWNKRIQVFDRDLGFLREWPVHAWEGMSVSNKPYIAVDGDGTVYVTDPEGYRVLKFSSDGDLVGVWGQYGTDSSSMNLPTGIEVDASGRVYTSDSDNNRILVFDAE